MSKKFKVGDTVYTDTHAYHITTREALSRRKGIVVDNKQHWNIQVEIEDIEGENPVGFSEFELSHEPITEYKNENDG